MRSEMLASGRSRASARMRWASVTAACGAALWLANASCLENASCFANALSAMPREDETPAKSASHEATSPEKSKALVQRGLASLAEGKGDWKSLSITYDDRHELHGGLKLAIRGDGKVEQQAVRTKAREPVKTVSRAELKELVEQLIELKAWEQKTPERCASSRRKSCEAGNSHRRSLGDDLGMVQRRFQERSHRRRTRQDAADCVGRRTSRVIAKAWSRARRRQASRRIQEGNREEWPRYSWLRGDCAAEYAFDPSFLSLHIYGLPLCCIRFARVLLAVRLA